MAGKRRLGVIRSVNPQGGIDVCNRIARMLAASASEELCDLVFESGACAVKAPATDDALRFHVYDTMRDFERRGVDAVLMPCFECLAWIDEVLPESRLPVINLVEAVRAHLERECPGVVKLGVLASDELRRSGLFERYFSQAPWQLFYVPLGPGLVQGEAPAPAGAVERIERACRKLLAQGAEIIVPATTAPPEVIAALGARGLPIVDVAAAYARHALDSACEVRAKPYKIGVVGGVGPAATVDFLAKIVRNTPAHSDQDHLKVVVEQNPQIPDRTKHLIGNGADPALALYATCRRLEEDEASVIAIPCNTAHAFVGRIQPYLSIPIVNMLVETAEHILRHYPERGEIGLLATTGTIESRVYHQVFEQAGRRLTVPDAEHQAKVMNAIYGPKGVKAGYTEGECKDDLLAALSHVVSHGAAVVILGCTELPLLLAQSDDFEVAGKSVVLLDPTDILARACVHRASA